MNLPAHKVQHKNYYSVREDISDFAFSRLKRGIPLNPNVAMKKGPVRKFKKEYALYNPYIQLNNPCFVSWIIVDVDCPIESQKMSSPYYFVDNDLPVPNMKISNPDSKNCQLLWAVDDVAVHAKANRAPINYLRATIRTLTISIKGSDRAFNHDLSQNPISDKWDLTEFHEDVYSLGEIYEGLPEESKKIANALNFSKSKEQKLRVFESGERNTSVFNALRQYCSKYIKSALKQSDYSSWSAFVLARAHEINDEYCSPRLTTNEVSGIAKSVSNGTWYKGYGQGRTKVMEFDDNTSTKCKQAQGGRYAAGKRKEGTLNKLKIAAEKMILAGEKLVKARLAKLAGVGETTVYRHIDFVKSIFDNCESINIKKTTLSNSALQVVAPVKALPSFKSFKVSFDGHISYKKDYYSTPSIIGSKVSVIENKDENKLSIIDTDGVVVSEHELGRSRYCFYSNESDLVNVDYESKFNIMKLLTWSKDLDPRLVDVIKHKCSLKRFHQQSYRSSVALLAAISNIDDNIRKTIITSCIAHYGLNLSTRKIETVIDAYNRQYY